MIGTYETIDNRRSLVRDYLFSLSIQNVCFLRDKEHLTLEIDGEDVFPVPQKLAGWKAFTEDIALMLTLHSLSDFIATGFEPDFLKEWLDEDPDRRKVLNKPDDQPEPRGKQKAHMIETCKESL